MVFESHSVIYWFTLFFKNQTIRTNLRASLQNRTTSSPIAHILLHNVPRCLEIRQSIIPPYTLSTPSVKEFVSAMCNITSEKPNEEFATMETLKRRSLVCYGNSLSPKSDKHLISPCKITTWSNIQVMRIK